MHYQSQRNGYAPRALAALSLALITSIAAGCGPADDADLRESAAQPLTAQRTTQFVFGSDSWGNDVTRFGRYRYDRQCSNYCVDWVPRGRGEICVKWEEQCHWTNTYAVLSASEADAINEVPFPAFNSVSEQRYLGCGPQAVFNLRNWYGFFNRTLMDVAQDTRTFELWVPWDPEGASIATTPVDLVDAVRNELNHHGNGASFTVGMYEVKGAFPNTVEASLTRGDPLIALVRGGSHWQVITGFRRTATGAEYHVIDYPGGGEWLTEGGLRRQLEGGMAVWGDLTGFGGYASDVVITVQRH